MHAHFTRFVAMAGVLGILGAGCSENRNAPTILVDYSHDEFNSQFIAYFPAALKVHAGDGINFRQTWTGEPHTVTLGTSVDEMLAITAPLIEEFGDLPESEIPEWVFEQYDEAIDRLPGSHNSDEEDLSQTVAQRCFIDQGRPPMDASPCPATDQPTFNGRQSYFNSGIIPFQTSGSNRFEMRLSDDIAPGVYGYYCAIHGPFQRGTIEVVADDVPVPSARDVAVQALDEIAALATPMRDTFQRATGEGVLVVGGAEHKGNFAGLGNGGDFQDGQINEFVPRRLMAKVGEPVTWLMFGAHSIAFDVPEYFPIVEFDQDGTVRSNRALDEPSGGSPKIPEEQGDGPLLIDGGTWSGSGFFSSGTLWSEDHVEYTLRFAKSGTYDYACLIHPAMVGSISVEA